MIDEFWLRGVTPIELSEHLEISPTSAPDPCHHDVFGFPLNAKESGNVLKKAWNENSESFFECSGEEFTVLNKAQL